MFCDFFFLQRHTNTRSRAAQNARRTIKTLGWSSALCTNRPMWIVYTGQLLGAQTPLHSLVNTTQVIWKLSFPLSVHSTDHQPLLHCTESAFIITEASVLCQVGLWFETETGNF